MFASPELPPGSAMKHQREPGRGIRMDLQIASPAAPPVEARVESRPDPTLHRLLAHVPALEDDIEKVLITEEEIQATVRRLGEEITRDYTGKDVLLVGVLKGAFLLMGDLARHIRLPLEFDFMAVSSYGAATKTSGVVRILKDLVDSGLTLAYLLKNLRTRKPASLEVCALLLKTAMQKVSVDLKYVGFEIPPEFVVGYGLDYGERFRNLPYVGTLKPSAYQGNGE